MTALKAPEEAAQRIFGQRAARYTTSACHTDPWVLGRVVALSAPAPDWAVLNLGTGTGHTAFALAPHVARVTGIDLTPEMLAEAKKLQAQHGLANVRWAIADVHRLPFDDAVFQLVTCRRAAHHFSRILQSLREMRRVLCNDGRLVIDDRSVPEDDFVAVCMNQLDRYHDESHVRQYRPSEWRRMLEALGFAVEAVASYIRHRPLTSLTDRVSPESVHQIHETLARLNDTQRAALNLVEVDGQWHLNHWYVMIAARKSGLVSGAGLARARGSLPLELLRHFPGVRKAAGSGPGEHQLSVHGDVKDAAASGDQPGLYTECLAQLVRQTGGLGPIVSLGAITDLDVHDIPPSYNMWCGRCQPTST